MSLVPEGNGSFIMTKQELGDILKAIRKEAISAPKLAQLTGLREAQISIIENGRANYGIDSLLEYCHGAGIDIIFKSKDYE